MYHLAEQLSAKIPHYRVAVHRHARVLRAEHERVAHSLHVVAVGTHMVEGVHLAVNRVGLDVERVELQRVGMHVERVLLRVVEHQRALRSVAVARRLVVEQMVAAQFVLVLRVGVYHVAESFVLLQLVVVEERVAGDGFLAVHDGGASEQLRHIRLAVGVGVGSVDDGALRLYCRRTRNVSDAGACVVVE